MSITRTLITTALAAVAAGTIVGFAAGWSMTQDDAGKKTREAIRTAALDYPQGWYTGDSERMASRLHPELRKCLSKKDAETSQWILREMTAEQLIAATESGSGTRVAEDERIADVQVLDVYGDIASVRITMKDWVDYMHMARIDGEWKVVNVLWDLTPEAKANWGG